MAGRATLRGASQFFRLDVSRRWHEILYVVTEVDPTVGRQENPSSRNATSTLRSRYWWLGTNALAGPAQGLAAYAVFGSSSLGSPMLGIDLTHRGRALAHAYLDFPVRSERKAERARLKSHP